LGAVPGARVRVPGRQVARSLGAGDGVHGGRVAAGPFGSGAGARARRAADRAGGAHPVSGGPGAHGVAPGGHGAPGRQARKHPVHEGRTGEVGGPWGGAAAPRADAADGVGSPSAAASGNAGVHESGASRFGRIFAASVGHIQPGGDAVRGAHAATLCARAAGDAGADAAARGAGMAGRVVDADVGARARAATVGCVRAGADRGALPAGVGAGCLGTAEAAAGADEGRGTEG